MSRGRRARLGGFLAVCLAAWVLIARTRAHATSYAIPADFQVACLDLKTGKKLWQRAPGTLSLPTLRVAGGVLVVEDGQPEPGEPALSPRAQGTRRYFLDLASGRPVRMHPSLRGAPAPVQAEALAPLGGLTDARGRTFVFDEGNTRALVARAPDGRTESVLELEDYLAGLNLVGNLAVFNFGTADVYAYDVAERRLAWEFDVSRKLRNLSDEVYTGTSADAQGVYVSVDQTLFALTPESGKLLWTTALPRQGLRSYDSPWTKVARVGDRLLVLVYEALFQIDPASGRILWSFPAGDFAEPWPLLYGDRLYVATRAAPNRLAPPVEETTVPAKNEREKDVRPELAQIRQQYLALMDPSHGRKKSSALRIRKSGAALTLEVLSRRELPPDEPVFWSLNPPPPAPQPAGRVLLKLWEGRAPLSDASNPVILDLTGPLMQRSVAHVRFSGPYSSAALVVDGKIAVTQKW